MWDSGDRLSGLTRKDWRGENTEHNNHKQIIVSLIIITSWAQTTPASNEANDLVLVVWEPGDGEGHGDQSDEGQGGGAGVVANIWGLSGQDKKSYGCFLCLGSAASVGL